MASCPWRVSSSRFGCAPFSRRQPSSRRCGIAHRLGVLGCFCWSDPVATANLHHAREVGTVFLLSLGLFLSSSRGGRDLLEQRSKLPLSLQARVGGYHQLRIALRGRAYCASRKIRSVETVTNWRPSSSISSTAEVCWSRPAVRAIVSACSAGRVPAGKPPAAVRPSLPSLQSLSGFSQFDA